MKKLIKNIIVAGGVMLLPATSWSAFKVRLPNPYKSEISGSIQVRGCHARPKFRVNGRIISGRNLRLSRRSNGYGFKLYISRSIRTARVMPFFDAGQCRGRMSPYMRYVSVRMAGSRVRVPQFSFYGNVRQSSIFVGAVSLGLFQSLQGMQIRLNNYGPRRGYSWYRGNDSWVRMPSGLGGRTQRFSIPAVNRFPYRYYVNNVNLSRVHVEPAGARFRVRLYFESNGNEFKGRCASKNKAKNLLCAAGSDKAAPDVQMNNAVATIYLVPAVSEDRRSITYGGISVDFQANIQAGGLCRFSRGLCNQLTGYRRQILRAVKAALYAQLDRSNVRAAVANAMRAQVQRQGIREIKSIRISGRHMIISHTR